MKLCDFAISALGCGLLLLGSVHTVDASETQLNLTERLEACAACHGKQGHSDAAAYYPSIAGKPAEYLYQQLLNFREGRRLNRSMSAMLAYLSTDYLHEIARYYADQKPRHTPPRGQPPSDPRGQQLLRDGDADLEVPACSSCHGDQLQGDGQAIPGLRGLSAEYIVAQLGGWKVGVRQARTPDCMASIAQSLSGEDIVAVARLISAEHFEASELAPAAKEDLPMPCGAVQ